MLYMKNSPALCMFISEISIKLFSVLEITPRLRGWQRSAADMPILLQPFVRQQYKSSFYPIFQKIIGCSRAHLESVLEEFYQGIYQ